MPAASRARINANRLNSLKSTGPVTPSGKSISRKNGLKHGMTGAGIVLAEEDASAVEVRASALMAELDPKSTLGQVLVGQIATLSVRMERGARREEEALASRVRHATEVFDHDRIDLAEYLFKTIADDPRGNLIELRRMPEGVDRLVEGWGQLRDVLMRGETTGYWEPSHQAMVANLSGFHPDQAKGSRVDLLSLAVRNLFPNMIDPEWKALDSKVKRVWARDRLVEYIDAEIAGLKKHRETFNLKAIELDRLGAPKLALFDDSHRATLARRYESEARRGFFKSLKEFHQAEAEAADRATTPPIQESDPAVIDEPLASSCAGPSPTAREPKPAPPQGVARPVEGDYDIARGLDGRVVTIGRAAVVPV
jgi:hypothetical protein